MIACRSMLDSDNNFSEGPIPIHGLQDYGWHSSLQSGLSRWDEWWRYYCTKWNSRWHTTLKLGIYGTVPNRLRREVVASLMLSLWWSGIGFHAGLIYTCHQYIWLSMTRLIRLHAYPTKHTKSTRFDANRSFETVCRVSQDLQDTQILW